VVVLGVDVGLRVCGYVLCQVKGLEVSLLKEGQIKPNPKETLPEKLGCIFRSLAKEVAAYRPAAVVVEKLYSHYRHPTTLGVLAQVRGLVAFLANQEKIAFFEYAPTRARKSFIGKGHANSQQVRRMAETMTGRKFICEHTADAYSLVVAFSHQQKANRVLYDIQNKRPTQRVRRESGCC